MPPAGLAVSGKRRNPGSQADIWMTVDSYLVLNEVTVHDDWSSHHQSPQPR